MNLILAFIFALLGTQAFATDDAVYCLTKCGWNIECMDKCCEDKDCNGTPTVELERPGETFERDSHPSCEELCEGSVNYSRCVISCYGW